MTHEREQSQIMVHEDDFPKRETTASSGGLPETWVPRYRRFALAIALAAAFIGGAAEHSRISPPRALSIVGFASAVTLWCGLDARMHGKLFLRSFAWLMMFTWPVGVLVHLIWTRRLRGIPVYLGLAAASIAASAAGTTLAAVLYRR